MKPEHKKLISVKFKALCKQLNDENYLIGRVDQYLMVKSSAERIPDLRGIKDEREKNG